MCQTLQKVEEQREPELVASSQQFLAPNPLLYSRWALGVWPFQRFNRKTNKKKSSTECNSHFLKMRKILYLYMFTSGRNLEEDDNTKAEAAKMQKEYENLKDSTKEEQPSTATSQSTVQSR